MIKLKVAFATNNGKTFMSQHFGDAEQYQIYQMDKENIEFLSKLTNTTEEDDEEIHADPKKAKSIVNLLQEKNVEVVVAKVFGPNIKRIKKKFVCILIKEESIVEATKIIQNNLNIIQKEWELGEERNFLSL